MIQFSIHLTSKRDEPLGFYERYKSDLSETEVSKEILDFLGEVAKLDGYRVTKVGIQLAYSAYSTDGVLVFGDRTSIDRVRAWHHQAGTIPEIRRAYEAQKPNLEHAANLVEYDSGGVALVREGSVYPPTADGYRVTPLYRVKR